MTPHEKIAYHVHQMSPLLLKQLCLRVMQDPLFDTAPGGATHHHNYVHGLVTHTSEVLGNAMVLSRGFCERDINVLTTAAVWHDYHKIYDYGFDDQGQIVSQPFRKMIGHLAGSWAEFYHHACVGGLHPDLITDIGHCLLAHHGRREWGSSVEPVTPLAFILHTADMLSVKGTIL